MKREELDLPSLDWLRAIRLLMLLLLAGLATASVASFLPHDPYFRFQQLTQTIQFQSKWIYERIHFDPAPIDIAIIGNSRLGAGVPGPALSDMISQGAGRTINVVNLSLPQEGRDVQYVLAKRLLERRPEVKILVVSVIEEMPRVSHPAFKDLADPKDIIAAPLLINRDVFTILGRLPFRQMSIAAQGLDPARFGLDATFDIKKYAGSRYDSTLSFRLPDGRYIDRDSEVPEKELAAQAAERVAADTPPLLPGAEEWEYPVERTYTRRLARIANASHVKLIFLRLPIYNSTRSIRTRSFYAQFGEVIDLAPDLAGRSELFSDYGHLNRRGALAVARLLSARLARSLPSTKKASR